MDGAVVMAHAFFETRIADVVKQVANLASIDQRGLADVRVGPRAEARVPDLQLVNVTDIHGNTGGGVELGPVDMSVVWLVCLVGN